MAVTDYYTAFEIRMGQIFHALYGSTTAPLEEQAWWGDVQSLKTAARAGLEQPARRVYEYAKIAVNQIVCEGGADECQPCQNREQLAEALDELGKALGKE